jgi:hypothetical protein
VIGNHGGEDGVAVTVGKPEIEKNAVEFLGAASQKGTGAIHRFSQIIFDSCLLQCATHRHPINVVVVD